MRSLVFALLLMLLQTIIKPCMKQYSWPLVSIIIPMFNVDKYIQQCLESVLAQSYLNIEIVIVDDCSSDRSTLIAQQYAEIDHRIKIAHHTENKGSLLTRKHGLELAHGSFCMFLDADDCFANDNVILTIVKMMCRTSVDILQFAISTIDLNGQIQDQNYSSRLKLYPGRIDENSAILSNCFECLNHHWRLWGKIYKMRPCRLAFSQTEDIHLTMGDDTYLYFLICFYSHSYLGVNTAPVYLYRIGSGISTGKSMTLELFQLYLTGDQTAITAINHFLKAHDSFDRLQNIYNVLYQQLLHWHFERMRQLSDVDKTAAFHSLLNFVPVSDIMEHCLMKYK